MKWMQEKIEEEFITAFKRIELMWEEYLQAPRWVLR